MSYPHRVLTAVAVLTLAALIFVGCASEPSPPSQTPAIVPQATATPDPTPEPTATKAPEPTVAPAPKLEPTPEPTAEPTLEATAEPTAEPTPEATVEPTPEPTPEPTAEPTPEPTAEPTPEPDPTAEATPEPSPPIAGERPHRYTYHGITVEDPWHWLEDEDYPTVDDEDVIAYLEAENDYFDAKMAPYQDLIDTIYAEIEGRQPAELASVPRKGGDWYYQSRYGEGSQYREWLRWPASDPDAREGPTDNVEVFLDEPALAEGLEYFRLGSLSVSNDGSKVAYSTDTNGTERYILVVKDLETGELLPEEIEETRGGAIWSTDDSSFFYTFLDETGHPFQVRRHIMGGPVEDDTVVYEETDAGFFVWVTGTNSEEYVIIGAGDHVTSEYRLIDADDPAAEPVLVAPRRPGHDYSIDHQGDRFVIMTNDNHQNYRMAIAPEDDPTEEAWETLLQGTESLYIQYFHVTEDYVAVEERIDGLDQVRIINRAGESTHVEFPEEAYTAYIQFDPSTTKTPFVSPIRP